MKKNRFQSRSWYPNAVAISIGVLLYVVLTHWADIRNGLGTIIGYFFPVILGCVIAYLVNPLEGMYERRVFRRMKKEESRHLLANTLAFVTVIVCIILAMLVLLPQLIDSITTFAGSLDGYMESIRNLLDNWDLLSEAGVDTASIISSSENTLKVIVDYAVNNIRNLVTSSAMVGNRLFQWVIGFMLSIYLLAEKSNLKAGARRLLTAVMGERRYESMAVVLRRCDGILTRYIMFNLLDCLIVGVVNAVFMFAVRFPYVGLVSFVVAISNLIPTFGPIVGAVIGAFVLLLVKPWYALVFLLFTLVLQICDGYVLKPRLFGSSLGVSGLWILIGVIVAGRMFGVVGILLAIPGVAILDFAYREYLMPWLERMRARKNRAEPGPDGQGPEAS